MLVTESFIFAQVDLSSDINVLNKGVYLRLEPFQFFLSHTVNVGLEKFVSTKHSFGAYYGISPKVKKSNDLLCLGCIMINDATSRQVIDFNYRFYPFAYQIFVGPVLRTRYWEGDLANFYKEVSIDQREDTMTSIGLALGAVMGWRITRRGRFDASFQYGYVHFVSESHHTKNNYKRSELVRGNLLLTFSFGINLVRSN